MVRRWTRLLIVAWAGFLPRVALAEIYTWVDDSGVLHFTNLEEALSRRPLPEDGFGGESPEVVVLATGETRKVFPADVRLFDEHFRAAANHYGLPFAYLKAVAKVESNFHPRAISRAKAKGLMQLMDGTAAHLNVKDPFDPIQNIFGGARYLRMLANMFDGDLSLTLAAYNAGPELVRRLKRVPNIDETEKYVRRVLEMYRFYQGADT